MRIAAYAALGLMLTLGGCPDEDTANGPIEITYTPTTPQDQSETPDLTVDELNIVSRLTDGGVVVTLPIELTQGDNVAASVEVGLGAIDAPDGLSAPRKAVTLVAGKQDVEVTIPGAVLPTDQAEQVAWTIGYTVSANGKTAYGVRSVFYTLPKYSLMVWAPNRVDAGVSTAARAWVTDLNTGAPVEGVPVSLNGGEPQLTDLTGQVELTVAIDEIAGSELPFTVTVTPENAAPIAVERTIQVVPAGSPKMFVSTDKPLYRPGQTMELRTLMLAAKDQTPMANEDVVFEVLDGKSTKVFREVAKTNSFGIASMRAPLAKQVNLGQYVVRVTTNEQKVERQVEVSEEKLPAFEVTVSLDEPYFPPGAEVTGTVQARYFFGQPVKDAVVAIAAGSATFNGTTDTVGIMPFTLPALPYGVSALNLQVTDTAGFAVTKAASALVADPSINVSLVPESSSVPNGTDWSLFVLTRGPTGAPVNASCTVGSDTTSIETGADGVGKVAMAGGIQGAVSVSCSYEGLEGTAQVASPENDWAKVVARTDKTLYQPGEPITLTVSGRDGIVFVDRLHRGRIVETREATIENGSVALTFTPEANESGTLQFTAYWLDEEGNLVNAQKTAYVRTQGAKVSVETSQDSYLPGTDATLTFKVTDESGAGKASAIGVAIADEAVFALAGATSPTDVQAHFVLDDVPGQLHPYALLTDPGDAQDAAAAAMASAGEAVQTTLFGDNASVVQSRARNLMWDFLNPRAQKVRTDLQTLISSGGINRSNVDQLVSRLHMVDPWGQPFQFEPNVRENWWGDGFELSVVVRSTGPSELADDWDDWSTTLWMGYLRDDADGDGFQNGAGGPAPTSSADASWSTPDSSPSDPNVPETEEPSGPNAPRDDFKETLFVDPAIITDANGEATVTIPLADNITSWRIAMIANSADGLLGGGTGNITVFQDFFVDVDLPKKLTVGDRLHLPIGVYNFSEVDQEITVSVEDSEWFDFLVAGDGSQTVTIPAGESMALPVGIQVTKAGNQAVTINAVGPTMSDGVVRTTAIVPNGQRHDLSQSGPLDNSFDLQMNFPASALEGGNDALLKIMGSPSAQMVDGVDALLQVPRGCFEPMMNSTWINGLVLDYLQVTGSDNADLMGTAKANLDDGLQQSVTFECTGGGFTWFGDPDPAHPILTAFALMMFEDFDGLTAVDAQLVSRAQGLLVNTQNGDGSWDTQLHTKNQVVPWDTLRTTCVAAWGLGVTDSASTDALSKAFGYIKSQDIPASDTYTLSMCANALLALQPDDPATDAAVAELLSRANTDTPDRTFFGSDDPGITLAQGDVITVETTAIAVQALYKMEPPPTMVEGALKWLSEKKSPNGNFMSTQGTIQALRGFVAAAKYGAGDTNATVTVTAGGQQVFSTQITQDNKDVVHFVSLTNQVTDGGDVDVQVSLSGEGKLLWQLTSQHYTPWGPGSRRTGPAMDIDVVYAPTTLTLAQSTTATLTVTTTGVVSPNDMPMVEFPIPPGFDVDTTALDAQVATDPRVARHETKDGIMLIYLHEVPQEDGPLVMELTLKPRQAMEVTAPASKTYPFYEPGKTSESDPVNLVVTAE